MLICSLVLWLFCCTNCEKLSILFKEQTFSARGQKSVKPYGNMNVR